MYIVDATGKKEKIRKGERSHLEFQCHRSAEKKTTAIRLIIMNSLNL